MKTRSSQTRKSKSSSGDALPNRGVQLVLGVLFIAAGALVTASFLMTANKLIGAGSWVETPCEIVSMKTVRSRKGGKRISDVTYVWEGEGKWFRSSNLRFPVWFGEGPEPGIELERSPEPGAGTDAPERKKSRCFVNPKNPSQAVYFRGIHAGAALFYLAGMIGLPYGGLLLLLSVFVEHPRRTKDQAARARNPDAPYFWRDDWERGVVEDRGRSHGMTAQYALLWTCPVAAVIAAFILFADGDQVIGPLFSAGFAGLVSVASAGRAILLRSSQFDRLVLAPVSFPPCAGYLLEGTIKLPRRLRKRASVGGVVMVTRLMQTSKDGLQPMPLATAPADVTVEGRVLTVMVALPNAPEASPHGSHLPVTWTLVLITAGDSLKATFELPVARAA